MTGSCDLCVSAEAWEEFEASVRKDIGYNPWRCDLCHVRFFSFRQARLHFTSPITRHPKEEISISEELVEDCEKQLYRLTQQLHTHSRPRIIVKQEAEPIFPYQKNSRRKDITCEKEESPTIEILEAKQVSNPPKPVPHHEMRASSSNEAPVTERKNMTKKSDKVALNAKSEATEKVVEQPGADWSSDIRIISEELVDDCKKQRRKKKLPHVKPELNSTAPDPEELPEPVEDVYQCIDIASDGEETPISQFPEFQPETPIGQFPELQTAQIAVKLNDTTHMESESGPPVSVLAESTPVKASSGPSEPTQAVLEPTKVVCELCGSGVVMRFYEMRTHAETLHLDAPLFHCALCPHRARVWLLLVQHHSRRHPHHPLEPRIYPHLRPANRTLDLLLPRCFPHSNTKVQALLPPILIEPTLLVKQEVRPASDLDFSTAPTELDTTVSVKSAASKVCSRCNETVECAKGIAKLQLHVRLCHMDSTPPKCAECAFEMTDIPLSDHYAEFHKGKVFPPELLHQEERQRKLEISEYNTCFLSSACNLCKSFVLQKRLRRHCLTKVKMQSFQCLYCSAKFKHYSMLFMHYKGVHTFSVPDFSIYGDKITQLDEELDNFAFLCFGKKWRTTKLVSV